MVCELCKVGFAMNLRKFLRHLMWCSWSFLFVKVYIRAKKSVFSAALLKISEGKNSG